MKKIIKLFLIIILLVLVVNVNFVMGDEQSIISLDEEDKAFIEEVIKELPKMIENNKKGLEKDPSADLTKWLTFKVRYANSDPRVMEIYEDIIKKSTHIESIQSAMANLYGEDRRERAVEILKGALNREFIDIHLKAADILFNWGYKEEVYPVYVSIITMKEEELKKVLENRPVPEGFNMELESEKAKNDPEYKKDIYSRINNWRTIPVLDIIEKLIEYDNSQTIKLIKESIEKNNYISSVISGYRTRELKQKWAQERRAKFFEKLEAYITKEDK